MKVWKWVASVVGSGLFSFGLFGVSETNEHLRKETELQEAIIRHYRLGHGPEVRARTEQDLDRHRNAKHLHSDSVVVNVFSILIGVGLNIVPLRSAAVRKKQGAAG